jgi:hypothetical protein
MIPEAGKTPAPGHVRVASIDLVGYPGQDAAADGRWFTKFISWLGFNVMADFSHFAAKVAPDKGPDPKEEFRNLLAQGGRHPKSVSWFATANAANDFHRAGNSICMLFYHPDGATEVEALIARVLNKSDYGSPPDEVKSFYEPWNDRLKNWWPLGGARDGKIVDMVLTRFESLDAIPGCSWKTNLPANRTFVGKASFAGWKFDDGFNPLEWLQSLPGERP